MHQTAKNKTKQRKMWSKSFTKFDVLELINIIKYTIFNFEDHTYIPLLIQQEKVNVNTLQKLNTSISDYL